MVIKNWHSFFGFSLLPISFISDLSLNPVMLLLLNFSSSHLHTRHPISLYCLSASSPVHSLLPRGPEGSTCPQSEGIGCLSSPESQVLHLYWLPTSGLGVISYCSPCVSLPFISCLLNLYSYRLAFLPYLWPLKRPTKIFELPLCSLLSSKVPLLCSLLALFTQHNHTFPLCCN